MNELLEQLHDIEELDPISWWPLAVGWWLLIVIAILVGIAAAYYIASRIAFSHSWRNDSLQRLAILETNLSEATARETTIALSEYLRRIAIRRYSRCECAGLSGRSWLRWLAKYDPKKFDWEMKGELLINLPYAPQNAPVPTSQIKELIRAVRYWVR